MKVSVAEFWFQLSTCILAKLCSVWNEMLIMDSGLRESQHTSWGWKVWSFLYPFKILTWMQKNQGPWFLKSSRIGWEETRPLEDCGENVSSSEATPHCKETAGARVSSGHGNSKNRNTNPDMVFSKCSPMLLQTYQIITFLSFYIWENEIPKV